MFSSVLILVIEGDQQASHFVMFVATLTAEVPGVQTLARMPGAALLTVDRV